MRAKSLRWCVMISGRGSNLQSILDSFDPLNVVLVVSNQPGAMGKIKAKRYGISVLDYPVQKSNWPELLQVLQQRKIEALFLAGFMRLVPQIVLDAFENRVVNIHPSLLPQYPGRGSFEKALEDGVQTGATIHFVDSGVDTGKVIRQKKLSRCFTLAEKDVAQRSLTMAEKHLTVSTLRTHWMASPARCV